MRRIVCGVLIWTILLAAKAQAVELLIMIDPAASNVTVELSISLLGTDSDSSPVSGTFLIDLDDLDTPGAITILDFDIVLTEQIDLEVGNIFGSLTATGTGLSMHYADPPTPFGPVALAGEVFAFLGVPTLTQGSVAYNAGGLACTLLSGSGLPCSDTINLGDQGASAADIDGTIAVGAEQVTLTSMPDLVAPLDPTNPDLGTMTFSGFLIGTAPCVPGFAGDVDHSGAADADDLICMLEGLSGEFDCAGVQLTDLDLEPCQGDGDLNLKDLVSLLDTVAGFQTCPDYCE